MRKLWQHQRLQLELTEGPTHSSSSAFRFQIGQKGATEQVVPFALVRTSYSTAKFIARSDSPSSLVEEWPFGGRITSNKIERYSGRVCRSIHSLLKHRIDACLRDGFVDL